MQAIGFMSGRTRSRPARRALSTIRRPRLRLAASGLDDYELLRELRPCRAPSSRRPPRIPTARGHRRIFRFFVPPLLLTKRTKELKYGTKNSRSPGNLESFVPTLKSFVPTNFHRDGEG